MKIKSVETFIVGQQLDEPFSFSQWEYDRRKVCLVRLTTDDGLIGWGEGYGPAAIVAAGIDFLRPVIEGGDPLHNEALWRTMYLKTLDFARRGTVMASVSALDVALWDLKGKALGQPVSVLLGGRLRDRVAVYATGLYFTGDDATLPERLADEALGYAEQGYRAIKMKVGHSPEQDLKNVAAVRAAIGPGVELMVDANHAYNRAEATRLAQAMEPYDISWFEEPISPEDYEGFAEMRCKTTIPIATGECEYQTAGFRRLFEAQGVDIAQPDICAAGGLTEIRRIAALAHAFNVNLTPHCWGTGIAFAAALHFVSGLGQYPGRMRDTEPLLEMDRTENPLRDKLIRPVFHVEDGTVAVPEVPGLGVDVDPDLLKEYREE